MNDRGPHLNVNRIRQLKGFLNCWRLTQQLHAPSIHPLELAAALEEAAQEIRQEEQERARKANEDYWEGYMDGH